MDKPNSPAFGGMATSSRDKKTALRIFGRLRQDELSGGSRHLEQLIQRLKTRRPGVAAELRKFQVIAKAQDDAKEIESGHTCNLDPAQHDASPPIAPIELPDFQILRPIGKGGFGTVWLAHNRHDEQYYAIKILKEGCDKELEGVRQFKRRGESSSALFPIGHVGQVDDRYYYVMPLADDAQDSSSLVTPRGYESMTLQRLIDRQTRLPIETTIQITRVILQGLEDLHAAGGIHRDVKPSNIMRLKSKWRLGDPGLVGSDSERPVPGGTRGFVPSKGADRPAADLYALGVTAFMMATGRAPHELDGLRAGEYSFDTKSPCSVALQELVLVACNPDPQQRFRTAQEMRASLDACTDPEQDRLGKSETINRTSRLSPRLVAIALALIAAVSIVATVGAIRKSGRTVTNDSEAPSRVRPLLPTNADTESHGLERAEIKSFDIAFHAPWTTERPLPSTGSLIRARYNGFVGEHLRIHAEFSSATRPYLIVLRPNGDVSVIDPMDGARFLTCSAFSHPRGTQFLTMSDGTGLQAFAVVASRPLGALVDAHNRTESEHERQLALQTVARSFWRSNLPALPDISFLFKHGQLSAHQPTDRGAETNQIETTLEICNKIGTALSRLEFVDDVSVWAFPIREINGPQ